MGALVIDLAIRLRWVLRDIDRKRTQLSPVGPEDLRRLIDMGMIVMSDDGRFCCKSRLRQLANRDSVVLTRFSVRSIHDGPSEE